MPLHTEFYQIMGQVFRDTDALPFDEQVQLLRELSSRAHADARLRPELNATIISDLQMVQVLLRQVEQAIRRTKE